MKQISTRNIILLKNIDSWLDFKTRLLTKTLERRKRKDDGN